MAIEIISVLKDAKVYPPLSEGIRITTPSAFMVTDYPSVGRRASLSFIPNATGGTIYFKDIVGSNPHNLNSHSDRDGLSTGEDTAKQSIVAGQEVTAGPIRLRGI